ncbi:amino acid adenylation domain-containing protein [Planktothrix sp. FACHB-1355]|uniref:non-ribosomal peptide synthetase n=1 Tax=Planktothrix sp. FACHB-1355 TaxID=2692854 RepID=UPI00168AC867|nr:non-ribosomal peptide synthetase [Planktothrix sp. FACHB-1355]MBD3557332.1 amino acid adenylation domain-containing protein [Planktothrix sp. FACHB-1355]
MGNQISFELDKSAEKLYWGSRLITDAETASFQSMQIEDGEVSNTSKVVEIELSPELKAGIIRLTNDSPILTYTVFLGALNICLYKYSSRRLVSLGQPPLKSDGNQTVSDSALLVFQNNLDPRLDFKQLLKQIQGLLKEDYAKGNLGFADFAKEQGLDVEATRSRLMPCLLEFEKVHAECTDFRTPLKIKIFQNESRFKIACYFDPANLSAGAVTDFARHLTNILWQAVFHPENKISEMLLPDEEERRLLVETFNGKTRTYAKNKPVHKLFEKKAAKNPDLTAVNLAGFSLTFRELNEMSNRLAHFLINSGVKPEENIGIALERSIETVVSVLGVLKAGAAFLPVDLQNPPERLGYILQDCGVKFLLTKTPYFDFLNDAAPEAKIICLDEEFGEPEAQNETNPSLPVLPNQSAYIIFTSGSTGFPKGVVVEHAGLINYVNWCLEKYPLKNELTMFHSPLGFDLTLTSIFPPLLAGKTIEIIPELPSVEGLAQSLSTTSQYNLLKITPSHLQLLSGALKRIEGNLNLDCLVVGGEALKPEIVSFWRENYPSVRFFNEYGPTETVVGCCVYEVKSIPKNNIPIGKPVTNQKLYVLDEFLNPVPIGLTGEIYISGVGLARGYHQKPELTAERFLPNPFAVTPGERMYRTGDLGRFNSDLNLEYLGRTDSQVKIRGFRIELNEVEFNLSLLPDIVESAAAVREDNLGQKRIVAYVVPESEQNAPALKDVRRLLRQSLPEYMLPTAIVRLDALPLTNNGKIDLKALPEPDWLALSSNRNNAANLNEDLLISIWSEILGVSDVSVDDNFFELGGHSLLATRVVARIREVWKTELEINQFFENPTIRTLAGWLETSLRTGQNAQRPPIQKRAAKGYGKKAPLSYSQSRLWFLEQLNPGSPLYNVQLAIKLTGSLDVPALRKSLNKIIERHEILRTAFVKEDNEPVQIVEELKNEIEIPVIDLNDPSDSPAAREEIRQLLGEELKKGFDLTKGYLLRTILIKTGDTEHIAVMTLHHIVFDGWSTAILVREIGECYRAFSTDSKPNLPELEIQYADFASWQREWLRGEGLESQLDFWRRTLEGIPAFLNLPTDKPRPLRQTINGDVVSLKFDENLVSDLKKLSQNNSATIFMTLMAGFRGLLYKYTGQNDILIGTPVAGRVSRELENLIGIFINNLVIRGFVEGKMTFGEMVKQEREVSLAAFSHQDVSWEKIVEELNPDRNLSHPPIFQVMLSLQNMAIGTLELGDLSMSSVDIPSAGARYDMVLRLVEVSGQISCSLEYNSDLFQRATVTRFLRSYQRLLTEVAENPGLRISDLSLLDEKEREQIIYDWNDTRVEFDRTEFIHNLISRKARQIPEKIAVQAENGFLTYGELEMYSDRVAARLRSRPDGRERVIGLCLGRSITAIVGIIGILKAGAAYLPLDPDYPADRLKYMTADAEVSLIITQPDFMNTFENAGCDLLLYDSLVAEADTSGSELAENRLESDNLAYMIYTSGSTGKPKGTMVSHRNLVQSTTARHLYYKTKPEVYLLLSSFSFDSSIAGIFWTLLEGGTLVIPPSGFEKDPENISRLIGEHQVTTLLSLPSVYNFILTNSDLSRLESLKVVIVAGEASTNELVRKHLQLMPERELHNEYGPTEASVWCSVAEMNQSDTLNNVSIGTPIPNNTVYILDENLQIVPPGVPGGIFIGGDGVTRGYYKRPELTAEKFLPDPFDRNGGRRIYRTGDIGRYRSDGTLEFRGREDEQIKIRGYRIELGEIETVMSEVGGIEECVVGVFQDSTENKKLVGFYVCEKDGAVSGESIRHHLKTKLPDYMIPQSIQKLDRIPHLPNGKVNRNGLPKPVISRDDFNQSYVAPSGGSEEIIAGIWAEVLEIDRIGTNDNFFDLGGHSFLIIQVHDRIQKKLGVNFPLVRLFEHTTVRALTAFLDSQNRTADEEISYENWADRRKKAMRSRARN